jgi:hypothetical protein
MAAAGGSAVNWHGLVSKVVLPAALSPIIAGLVAATRDLAAVPDHPEPDRRDAQARLPGRADRLGVHGVARARHQ